MKEEERQKESRFYSCLYRVDYEGGLCVVVVSSLTGYCRTHRYSDRRWMEDFRNQLVQITKSRYEFLDWYLESEIRTHGP